MIEFFFDCSSPWTYLAFHNIQPLAAEFGVEIAWRPILVGGIFNTINPSVYAAPRAPGAGQGALFGQGPAGLGALGGADDQDAAQRLSGEQRQGDARLHLVLEPQGKLVPFARAVFEAYWGDDQDISQDAVLARDLQARRRRCRRTASPRIGQQAIKDQLTANTDEVMAPRRLRLADHLRRQDRHVFRQRPPAADPRGLLRRRASAA